MKKNLLCILLLLPMFAVAQSKKVTPVVVAESNHVMRGATYKAKIVPTSESLAVQTRFFVNGKELKNGNFSTTATGIGINKNRGYMLIGNDTTRYPFTIEYFVGEPSCTINFIDNEILYRGYENRIVVSVPGVPNNLVSVACKGGSVEQKRGIWIVKPDSIARDCAVSVFATIGGKKQLMGSKQYRVKPLPTPNAYLIAKNKGYGNGDWISKNVLLNGNIYLDASYGFDGVLDMSFKVTEFTLLIKGQMIHCDGATLSQEALEQIQLLQASEPIVFIDIKTNPIGGQIRNLNPIYLRIN